MAPGIAEIIDPSGISQADLKWQPPLGSWLSAAAVHLPGPIERARARIGRLLLRRGSGARGFFLATRLFSRRIGFIAAVMFAVHSTFLEQHQNATPHALAVLTALVTFWGFLGHLRHGGQLVSIDLLVGGISLGLCLLAGGPLAFAVVAVLLMLILATFEPTADTRRNTLVRRERWWTGWPALRSLGVLVATAFRGGWWELMMLYSYGGRFLEGWLWGMRLSSSGPDQTALHVFSEAFALRFVREFFAMSRVLAGFTFLGLWTVGRGLFSSAWKAQRRSLVFVAAWFLCALVAFAAGLRRRSARFPLSEYVAAVPDVRLHGVFPLWPSTRSRTRRIGLSTFASVTVGSLLMGYFFLHQGTAGGAPSAWFLLGGLALAFVVGQASAGCANAAKIAHGWCSPV